MSVPVIVLNFGHSVLCSLDDYTRAASEIYRLYRKGNNVVAVTSAQGDQTDILEAEARQIGPEGRAKNLPELIQLGERRSAALLALALERIGAPAFVRQARDLGLTAQGDYLNAQLMGLNTAQLQADLKAHDVVVMPGYVAIGEQDRAVLLGQGGADLTALFVAQSLGVEAILLKDVDGIYAHDPKQAGPAPQRYKAISWDDAAQKAAPLIEPKALGFARKHHVQFHLGRPAMPDYTFVGPKTGALSPSPKVKKLRLAMMGCGAVGGGVVRQVAAHNARFEMAKIMVRNRVKYIDQGYDPALLTTDFQDLLDCQPDIFIDVSGPIEPALGYSKTMLMRGVHVVSANKQAIAHGGQNLLDLARKHKAQLLFSSAAGGGMPILEMCQRARGRIKSAQALLNGTTNYMLGKISAGASYDEALKDAQEKGFAEADPSSDVGGGDAAAKIQLMALLGFGHALSLDDIPRDTIENYAPDAASDSASDSVSNSGQNSVVKRVANIWQEEDEAGKIKASLELKALPPEHFLAGAEGEEARAIFTFTNGDVVKIRGKGAGRWPTTESVMADLSDISALYIE